MSSPLPDRRPLNDPAAIAAPRPRTTNPLDAPSVRTVAGALVGGRMTAMQLRNASGLPRRTIYRALFILREEGLVRERRSLQDSRQSYYWLVAASLPPASNMPLDTMATPVPADEPATSVL